MKREVIAFERKQKQKQKTYACQFYGRGSKNSGTLLQPIPATN